MGTKRRPSHVHVPRPLNGRTLTTTLIFPPPPTAATGAILAVLRSPAVRFGRESRARGYGVAGQPRVVGKRLLATRASLVLFPSDNTQQSVPTPPTSRAIHSRRAGARRSRRAASPGQATPRPKPSSSGGRGWVGGGRGVRSEHSPAKGSLSLSQPCRGPTARCWSRENAGMSVVLLVGFGCPGRCGEGWGSRVNKFNGRGRTRQRHKWVGN